ncbi:MAG: sensor histidine kinase, partial [Christensenellales bacterium]
NDIENIMLIVQDITNEKKMEIESRKALKDAYEAANRANHSKTEFLSNMSHDIRTPMNAIVGMTAIAGTNIDDKDRVIDCLGKITKSSRHLLSLINEVLDMSRIESGRLTLSEEDFNLPELIDNLIAMTKNDIEIHNHNFEVRVGKIYHENVSGDSLRIQQIIINVMSN